MLSCGADASSNGVYPCMLATMAIVGRRAHDLMAIFRRVLLWSFGRQALLRLALAFVIGELPSAV